MRESPATALEPDAIGVVQDTVIGMASSAPAAVVATTLAPPALAASCGGGPIRAISAIPCLASAAARSTRGSVPSTSGRTPSLRREAAGLLAGPDPWTWLAERDGEAVGLLSAQRPQAAGWITAVVGSVPAAYLPPMFVEPGERGRGVGAASRTGSTRPTRPA